MNGEQFAQSKPSVGFKYEEDEGDSVSVTNFESFSIDIYDMAHSIKIQLYEKDGEDMIGEAKKYCHAICNNSSQVEEFEIDEVVTISMVVEYKDLTKQSQSGGDRPGPCVLWIDPDIRAKIKADQEAKIAEEARLLAE